MSGSSGPDSTRKTPHIDITEIEEAERTLEQELRTETALGVVKTADRVGLTTALFALPGTLWLLFYLVAPVVMIVLVSFWTTKTGGFTRDWTLDHYRTLFGGLTYWNTIKQSFFNSCIITVASFLIGFPVAYYLALKVQSLRNQIALFIVVVAPFWTSYIIRSVAWLYPLMGREGAVNQVLEKIGLADQPKDILAFSNFSVVLAMIQLYVLFMVTPLFFLLAQVDRSSIEAARDLGANWWKTFREVILPQISPGIVIGTIFVFVLTMGEYATVFIVGGKKVASAGTFVRNLVNQVLYPDAAAAAVFLVLVMMLGVFALLRFSNLREEL